MGQGPQLAELQQRVEAIGLRFTDVAEETRRRSELLVSRLDTVEAGFVRSRQEIERLNAALAQSNDERAQLYGMVQNLLGLAEQVGRNGNGTGLQDLEARVDALCGQAAELNGTEPGQEEAPAAAFEDDPEAPLIEEIAETDEVEGESDAGPGSPNSAGNGADHGAGEAAHPAGAFETALEAHVETVEDESLELSRTAEEDDEGAGAGNTEIDAVQDIFKRVSLITGKLRESGD